jgi:bacterioferritin-associated ferredoxin
MYVCLCRAVTSKAVIDAIEAGATTTRKVAEACGAGTECGRCRNNVRRMIEAHESSTGGRTAALRRRFFH